MSDYLLFLFSSIYLSFNIFQKKVYQEYGLNPVEISKYLDFMKVQMIQLKQSTHLHAVNMRQELLGLMAREILEVVITILQELTVSIIFGYETYFLFSFLTRFIQEKNSIRTRT